MNGTDYARGLRAIAEWYEAHPDMPVPYANEINVYGVKETRDEAARIAARQLVITTKTTEVKYPWKAKSRSRVVFPAPFGPSKPNISPSFNSKEILSTAVNPPADGPNFFVRFFTWIMAIKPLYHADEVPCSKLKIRFS